MQGFGSATTTTRRGGTSGCWWAELMLGTASESGPSGPRPVARGRRGICDPALRAVDLELCDPALGAVDLERVG
eukprot:2921181-Rhodomonas_salina.1